MWQCDLRRMKKITLHEAYNKNRIERAAAFRLLDEILGPQNLYFILCKECRYMITNVAKMKPPYGDCPICGNKEWLGLFSTSTHELNGRQRKDIPKD